MSPAARVCQDFSLLIRAKREGSKCVKGQRLKRRGAYQQRYGYTQPAKTGWHFATSIRRQAVPSFFHIKGGYSIGLGGSSLPSPKLTEILDLLKAEV
jgi:hypothetical protein